MLDLFRRLRPVLGKRIDELWLEYNTSDKERRTQIEELLMILAVRKLGIGLGDERIVLEPPPAELIGRGEYTIGNVEYPGLAPYPFRLSRNELLRHVFLLGPSGTGKSTFIIGLLRQFLRDRVLFWCIDFKRNYRCSLADAHGNHVLVFTLGRELAPLALNVLAPPRGVEHNSWVEALSDIICVSFLLLHGARNVLKGALLGAIADKGDRARLRDALALITNELVRSRQGSRRYGWLESTHRALEELSTGTLGESLNAANPLSLHELLAVPVVFELEGLGEDQQRFVSLFLLQSMLFLRKHETIQREVLRHVLIFDEAHNIFRKDQWGELSLPSKLAREVREYGEALVSATQQADVADSLIANSGTKIILRTDHPKDVDFTSKLLQVEGRWISKIPIGHGIARLATRYYQSFLFTFPEQSLKNTLITDERVQQRYAQWATSLVSKRARENPELGAALHDLEQWARTTTNTPTSATPRTIPTIEDSLGAITEKEGTLLQDIAAYPISTVTERYERLEWNPKTGTVVRNALFEKGLVSFETVVTLTGRIKILTLTTEGTRMIDGGGRARRHGGAAHEYWREQCRRWLSRHGYTVVIEHPVGGGKAVDLYGKGMRDTMIIEIETGKGDIPATIAKLAGLPGRRVLFVINEETAATYRTVAGATGLELWTPHQLRPDNTD